ncbi:MAG: large-conductance mechanosensitive channel protein MscL [Kiritimatiellia bacterium]
MSMIGEFREFAVKGNVMDMAVGIIIGAAFGKIVSSLVTDIIMPPIGVLIGGVNFSALALVLKEAVLADDGTVVKAAVTLNYGKFIQTVLDFLIVAWAIFMLVKGMNNLRRIAERADKKEAAKEVAKQEAAK